MVPTQHTATGSFGNWHLAMWAAFVALLACPLIAMRFTDDVRWDLSDFAAAAALLIGLGVVIELAFRLSQRAFIRAGLIGTAAAAVVVIWADAAVQIF